MRALIRFGIGVLGLLLAGSISNGYVWISPVTRCPLGHAPDMYSVYPMYYMGSDHHIYGPYYYLRPPFPPQQGFLPGPIGQAIQSGFLPHELLMSKKAMTIGDMPLLKDRKGNDGPPKHPGHSHMGGPGPAPNGGPPGEAPYDGPTGAYAGPAYSNSGVPGPFPMLAGPMRPGSGPAQVPYMGNGQPMGMPGSAQAQVPYMGNGQAMGMPYGQPMPYPQPQPYPQPMPFAQQMPYPGNAGGMAMPPSQGVPMMYPRPMYYPTYGPGMGMMPNGGMPMMQPQSTPMMNPQPMPLPVITDRPASYMTNGGTIPFTMSYQPYGGGLWLVQNTTPNPQANPYMTPTPNGAVPFNPYAPRGPMYPMPMPNPAYGRSPMMPPYGAPYPYPPQGMMMPNPYGANMSMPSLPSLPSMMSVPPTPGMSSMPSVSTMPAMPSMSNMSSYPAFSPYGSLDQFSRLQRPALPRMEMAEPPPMKVGNAYPTHPFVRSPRDFFMWGDSMDDERARSNRPFPVP